MARHKYVTSDYIEQVEHYLYNNLPLSDLEDVSYPVDEFNKEVVEQLLKEGEEYIRLDRYEAEQCVLTNYGRVINTKKINQYSVRFTLNYIHLYIRRDKVDFPGIFEEQGWEWDIGKIFCYYEKYNWRYVTYEDFPGFSC
jgi:hypothetical protein